MATFLAILKMLPAILDAVRSLEAFAPIPEQGKAKLDLILGIANDVGGDALKMVPIITGLVNRIVAFANAVGIFPKAQ